MKYSSIIIFILGIAISGYGQTENQTKMDSTKTERFERGWEKLKEIDGEAGVKVIESLKDISPDLGKYTIEYPFGDVYSREILDNRTKEIAVVAALTAMGNARPQLKVHINAALNVGVTEEELSEIMILMSVYAGFPSALNGTSALKEVLEERKVVE
ncbi:4-carboxymuconolactone decarboxylase [Flagellimonas taeanensis]|uniref:4-carboxymuconolactone decarboxylase n=1 Tax=Flagellimonas taeanensis TaxID=1005926 RepID=A0A1M6SF55_9FLAO|nr:carboxymuconolactone decarboxylase family protein [Allomuricauda taeanensis]SFB80459.1 4-carboxymuconolactone decarboxylase [Allomuricauda taeanensis]SHK43392.1 4-carboxymuconolactone decarboxylase [Allomuricauda taeanensis]